MTIAAGTVWQKDTVEVARLQVTATGNSDSGSFYFLVVFSAF